MIDRTRTRTRLSCIGGALSLIVAGLSSQLAPVASAEDSSGQTRHFEDSVSSTATTMGAEDVLYIDSGVEGAAELAAHVRTGVEVVRLKAGEDAVVQMQRDLTRRHGLRAVRLVSHAGPGVLYLGGRYFDDREVKRHSEAFRAVGRALRPGGEVLLYGCELADGTAGREMVRNIAVLTGASVAASTNKTGSAALGGDWCLEHSVGTTSAGPLLVGGYKYAGLLPAPIIGVDPISNTVYVRPGGISNTWTFGPFNSVGNAGAGIPDGPATVNHLGYLNDVPNGFVLTRGKFQYTTDGTNWVDMVQGSIPGPTIAGKTYRFVDQLPADTTTNNSFFTAWDYISYGSSTSTGQNVTVDNPPTDVATIALDYWGTPATGDDLVGLTKTDTGNSNGGVYAIDSQSVSNLFTISGTKLALGSGTLPAVGSSSTVSLRYYDYYQTDNTGAPISGQGITRTVTLTRRGNPTGFGSDLHVNTFQTNAQSLPQVAGLSDGSFVVVWRSVGQDGETTSIGGIYAQKFTSAGVASGSEFAISPAGNAVSETNPSVAALSGGRFVVAYQQSNTDNDIRYRIVAANGTVGTESFAPSTNTGAQSAPAVAVLPNGNFVISWIGPNGADTADVWVRQFDGSTGSAVTGSELVVNTTQTGSQSLPSIAPLSDNNYAVTWRDPAALGDVRSRVMGTTAAVSSEIAVITTATAQNNPRSAGLSGGGFVVVYSDAAQTEGSIVDTTSQSNIYAQRYDNTGTLQGTRFLVNGATTGNQTTPAIAALSGGGFLVSWQSNTDPDATGGLFGRRFTSTGTADDSYEFQLNERRIDTQSASALAPLASNSFAAAWADNTLDGASNPGIGARLFTAAVTTPNLSINDVSLSEGNSGTTSFSFTVSLSSAAPAGGVTFDIATADGTATQPSDYTAKSLTAQTIPAGSSTYTFTVLVNGDTTPESSEVFFVNVTNVTGATVADGQGQGTITTDDVAPTVTTNPNNQTVTAGQSVTFTAAASGTPSPTVQWQQSTDGGSSFQNVGGATSTTLSFTAASGQNGTQFRAVFTNASGTATTTAATLTVNFAPTVTTNPNSQTIAAGSNVTFTAAASGNPTPTVQWQQSTDGGSSFQNVAGATSTTLSFTAQSSQNLNQYRAVFTNSVGSATTTAATLNLVPTVTSISPTSGPTAGGTTVTITGTNFTGVTSVTFGATAASGFTFNTSTSITATSPAGTGTVDVRVTTGGGTTATSAADQFTYIVPPALTVSTNGPLNLGSTGQGTAGAAQSFSVGGSNLTANLVVTAPAGVEVSTSSGSGYSSTVPLTPASGAVATTTIFARIASAASVGAVSGNITVASTGATTQNVSVTGTVTPAVVVTNADDSGAGSLRAAITSANAATGSTITFDPTFFATPKTITLASALPAITNPTTITGPGANLLTVSGNGISLIRVFTAAGGTTISGLNIINGNTGISATGGTVTATDCTFSGMINAGLGSSSNTAVLNATRCTFSGNDTAINVQAASGAKLAATNCTVVGNTYGVYFVGTSGTVTNCTFSRNSSYGIYVQLGAVTVTNSLLAGNGTNIGVAAGTTPGSSNNLLVSTAALAGLQVDGSGNAVLANNGASTQTVALLPGSPAIDAGTATGAPTTDQRGKSRVSTVDIGAFEAQAFVLTLGGGNNQSRAVNAAFSAPLVVNVSGTGGDPVDGGVVTFTAPGSGASLSPATSTVAISSGTASLNATANTTAGGPYTVAATAAGASPTINFSLTNTAGAPSSITAGPGVTPQAATVNTAFATALAVTVTDSFGNPVPSTSVTFTAPASGASGTFSTSTNTITANTNSSGVVTAGTFTANTIAGGPYNVSVSAGAASTSVSFTNNPGPAASLTVSAPGSTTAGVPFNVSVTALDAFGNGATGYSGTVHFTSTDGSATLPADTTLTNGAGTFSATLKTAGSRTITATDTVASGIAGTSGTVTVSADAATHYAVSAPGTATAGTAFNLTVTALDQFNNTATGYGGTVHFTSTDGGSTLPADSTLTNGTGTFSATLTTAGTQTISATDTVSSSITGTSGSIAVGAAAATHYTVNAPATTVAGTAFNVTVTAFDQFNNAATGYAGTVHFTSTDASATLPADTTLTNGGGTFSATLSTAGNQTITATDTVASSIKGTSGTVTVTAGAATHFSVSAPASAVSGSAFDVTVTALDAFNNTDTTYGGTVHFTSTDATATLPADSTLTSGTGTFSATLAALGVQTIAATDSLSFSIQGISQSITVAETPSLVVTTVGDVVDSGDGQTSLREALTYAATLTGAQTITFSSSTANGATNFHDGTARTITLVSGALFIGSNVAIHGPAGGRLTVSGNDVSRVFDIGSVSVAISKLTISHGVGAHTPPGTFGGGLASSGTVTLTECTITGNAVNDDGSGGGIYNSGTMTLTNCTVSGNSHSRSGGGIANAGTLTLTNCTISGNSAGDGGGVVRVAGTVNCANTIIAGNSAMSAPDVEGAFTSQGYNLVGQSDGSTGFTATGDIAGTIAAPVDPQLGPLQDNGGPTQTIALLSTSPALNAGSNALALDAVGAALNTDQRGTGFIRVRGATVDIGAFEGNALPTLTLPTSPFIVEATSASGAAANFTITANDPEDGALMPTATPPSGSFFPLGDTSVDVSATDNDGAIAMGSFTVRVVDTTKPTITPINGTISPLTIFAGKPLPDYLSQVVVGDAVGVSSVSQSPAAGSPTTVGTVTVTITATDPADNMQTLVFDVAVVPPAPIQNVALAQGDTAPGAGTAGGPPAGAMISGLGQPAVDEAGNIAVAAKWKTSSGTGAGLFTRTTCLALAGAPVPGVSGATYKTFSDPVIDHGRVVSLVTLAGVPANTSAAILTATTAEDAQIVARAGDVATADGAIFKSFTTAEVRGNVVGFAAKLVTGKGTPKTTAANDDGVWVQAGGSAPLLALREGATIGTQKIKSLVTFNSSAGSRGQGRGWLTVTGAVPTVLARVLYTNGTQASLSVEMTGGIPAAATLLESDTTIPGGFFVEGGLGLPAINANDQTVTLASIDTDRGAQPSILANLNATEFVEVAARTYPTPVAGTVFSSLQDPVLSAEGSLAFPAKISGAGIKGSAANTLWWQPMRWAAALPESAPETTRRAGLTLLARGGGGAGGVPNDLPTGAQWNTFTSLAIAANRGPLFIATLVVGKGGVTASNSTGVWAMDFTGKLLTLFRTGDTIGTKKLKSFTLLTPTVGNTGVTRSFNGSGQVVWLATFTDKSTAIVTTEVP